MADAGIERAAEQSEAARNRPARTPAAVALDHSETEPGSGDLQALMSVVAHELRTPLTAASGYVQIALRADTPPQKRERCLKASLDALRRMDRLVNDLLDAGCASAGGLEVRSRPTDLVVLASRVLQDQQAAAGQRQIALEAPERLEGEWDADRLEQVLANLVSNALKYSQCDTEVRMELRPEGDRAVVSVSDHGVGLPAEELDRLFHPFARLRTGQAAQGTGLGLYVSKSILRAHGGDLWAESPGPGQGATFVATLPLTQKRGAPGLPTRP